MVGRCEMELVDAEEDIGIIVFCPGCKQEVVTSCLLRLNQLPPTKEPASPASSPGEHQPQPDRLCLGPPAKVSGHASREAVRTVLSLGSQRGNLKIW